MPPHDTTQPSPTPPHAAIDVANEFFDALEQRDWPRASALMHPDALAAFKKEYLAIARASDSLLSSSKATAESFLRTLIALAPDAAKNADVDALLADFKAPSNLSLAAFNLKTVAELEALPDPEAFERWLAVGQHFTCGSRRIVSAAMQSDSLAYIIYTKSVETPGRFGTGDLRLLTVRLTGAGWRVFPPNSI